MTDAVEVQFIVTRTEYLTLSATVPRDQLFPRPNTLDPTPLYDAYQAGQYEEFECETGWTIESEDIDIIE